MKLIDKNKNQRGSLRMKDIDLKKKGNQKGAKTRILFTFKGVPKRVPRWCDH